MEGYLIDLSLRIAPLFCVFLAAFLQSITGLPFWGENKGEYA